MARWKQMTFDELPALSVRGPQLRRALRLTTMAWAFGIAWMATATGSHVAIYCRLLGFNDRFFGLLAAMPFLASLGQVPAALLIERTGLRKYQFIHYGTAHRALWLVVAVLWLVLPAPSLIASTAMVVVVTISGFLAALSAPAWITWMGDVIPRRIRGRYFARRGQITQGVQILVVGLIGLAVDAAGGEKSASSAPTVKYVIMAVFVLGALAGMTDILLFRRLREVLPERKAPAATLTVRDILVGPLRDRGFVLYVLYGAMMIFAITFSGWFYWRTALEHLQYSTLATNMLFQGIGPTAGILTARPWGALIDRWGRRPVLILATATVSLSVIPWLLAQPDMPWVYALSALGCLLGGAGWNGVNLAQTSVLLGYADGSGRSRYVAASAVLISLGGVAGGLAGGELTQALAPLRENPWQLGPLLWTTWPVNIACGLGVFALAMVMLWHMPDPGSGSTRDMVRAIRANAYGVIQNRLLMPLRVFGWRSGGKDSQDRKAA